MTMSLLKTLGRIFDGGDESVGAGGETPPKTPSTGASATDAAMDAVARAARSVKGMDRELQSMAGLVTRSAAWLAGMGDFIRATTDGNLAASRKMSKALSAHESLSSAVVSLCDRMASTAVMDRATICRKMAEIRSGRPDAVRGETMETLEEKLALLRSAKADIKSEIMTLSDQVRQAEALLVKAGRRGGGCGQGHRQSLDSLAEMLGVGSAGEQTATPLSGEDPVTIGTLKVSADGTVSAGHGPSPKKGQGTDRTGGRRPGTLDISRLEEERPKKKKKKGLPHEGTTVRGRESGRSPIFAGGAIRWTVSRGRKIREEQ